MLKRTIKDRLDEFEACFPEGKAREVYSKLQTQEKLCLYLGKHEFDELFFNSEYDYDKLRVVALDLLTKGLSCK